MSVYAYDSRRSLHYAALRKFYPESTFPSSAGNRDAHASNPETIPAGISKRHEEIERSAARMDVTSQDGLQKIAGSTRAEKVAVEPEELLQQWREASGDHLSVVKGVIAGADGTAKAHHVPSASDALDRAQAEVFERHSTIDERTLCGRP